MPAAAEGIAADDRFAGRPFTCYVLAASDHEPLACVRPTHVGAKLRVSHHAAVRAAAAAVTPAELEELQRPKWDAGVLRSSSTAFLYSACQAHARYSDSFVHAMPGLGAAAL